MRKSVRAYMTVLGLSIVLAMSDGLKTEAAGDGLRLLQADADGENVIMYVEGEGADGEPSCQIGMTACEDVAVQNLQEAQIDFQTIVLVDNSLSVTEENSTKITDVLNDLIDVKSDQESMSIAVFGEDIEFLAEKSKDAAALHAVVEQIVRNDQDTYLTDILYDLLDTLDGTEYTRFIVISDGVDNKDIGITKDELIRKLEKQGYPIYTLGYIYKNNDEELENMFALSRATNGETILLDETPDAFQAAAKLSDISGIWRICVPIPHDLMDGSRKNVLLTFSGGTGEKEVRAEVDMPFSVNEQSSEPEKEETAETEITETQEKPEPDVTAEHEPAVEEEPEPESAEPEAAVSEPEQEQNGKSGVAKYIAVVLLLAAAVLLVLQMRKKNKPVENTGSKDEKKKTKEQKKINIPKSAPADVSKASTPVEPAAYDTEDDNDGGTVLLARRYLLVLKDSDDLSKVFRYPIDGSVTIGRNIDRVNIAIDYNPTVSGKHCEVTARGGRFYVRDLGSSNHTYVNGRIIKGETELRTGNLLRIGEVELLVEITPM